MYRKIVFCLTLLFVASQTQPSVALQIPTSEYASEQSYFIAHSIPQDTLDKRVVKIALLSDGLLGDNPYIEYSRATKFYDAVKDAEYKITSPLDWEGYKKYPGTLGTFAAGLLISKPVDGKGLKPITSNAQLAVINVSDGFSGGDKVYAKALTWASSWGADIVINGASLYETYLTDKALLACTEIGNLAQKGVAVINPASTDKENNKFSLADCSQSINIGYVDKRLNPMRNTVSRNHRLVAIGEDVLSFNSSGSQFPYSYSTSNQWSAVIAGGVIGKLFSNTDLNTLTIAKSLDSSSLNIEGRSEKLINYDTSYAYLTSKGSGNPLTSQIVEQLSRDEIGRVSGILTNDKGFEVSIKPTREGGEGYKYIIHIYKKSNSGYLITKKVLEPGAVRLVVSDEFTTGSFVLLETLSSSGASRFSIPFDDSTFLATPQPSDPRAKITEFTVSWVKDGILVESKSDSSLGSNQPRGLVIVDNLDWNLLSSYRISTDKYLITLPLQSPMRWQELGVGLYINDSEIRKSLEPYFNTKIALSSTGKNKYLIKGTVGTRYCPQSCLSKKVEVIVDGKIYRATILPTSGNFYINFTSKNKVKNITLQSSILRAEPIIR